MTLVESLHEKRKLFRATLAAKAVPDRGIDLSRSPAGFTWQKSEGSRRDDEAFGPVIAPKASAPVTPVSVPVTVEDEAFGPIVLRNVEWQPTVEEVQRAAARYYGMTRIELISARRTANIVLPRQVAMYLAKTMTARSLPYIGRRFGNRDHTTVLHAVRKIAGLRREDAALAGQIEELMKIIHPTCVVSAYPSIEAADAAQPAH